MGKGKVYISGPMTGFENYNRKAFSKAHIELEATKEWDGIVNPIVLATHLEKYFKDGKKGEPSYDDYLEYDLLMLEECSAIYMLDGWSKSNGARKELDKAKRLGLEVLGAQE